MISQYKMQLVQFCYLAVKYLNLDFVFSTKIKTLQANNFQVLLGKKN